MLVVLGDVLAFLGVQGEVGGGVPNCSYYVLPMGVALGRTPDVFVTYFGYTQ